MNKERLLKLARHLERGKLGHKYFNFNVFNVDSYDVLDKNNQKLLKSIKGSYDRNGCGTVGCAIGELPIIDPENWKFSEIKREPTYIKATFNNYYPMYEHASEYFDITLAESQALFCPAFSKEALPHPWNTKVLQANATKHQVARSIRNFIKWKESNETNSLND